MVLCNFLKIVLTFWAACPERVTLSEACAERVTLSAVEVQSKHRSTVEVLSERSRRPNKTTNHKDRQTQFRHVMLSLSKYSRKPLSAVYINKIRQEWLKPWKPLLSC